MHLIYIQHYFIGIPMVMCMICTGHLRRRWRRVSYVRWWLNVAPQVLRTMFGSAVHYVDWSDFVVRCLNLPFPSAEHLSELQRQYAALELNRAKTMQCPDRVIVKGQVIIKFGIRHDTCPPFVFMELHNRFFFLTFCLTLCFHGHTT